MGTAIWTGVTGLKAYQRRLDVIANNIANVNTTGYRSSRVLFQDLFSQTLQGARAPEGSFGGTNPQQTGLGVRVASIDTNFTQGTLITTGLTSDLAVQGAGMFILGDGESQMYTRDGSFTLNANGELIDPGTGLRVQGYMADENGMINLNAGIQTIVVPVGGAAIAQATSTAEMMGNLSSDATTGEEVIRMIRVYDSLGTSRDVEVTFTKTATSNQWAWTTSYTDDAGNTTAVGTGNILFDAEGQVDPATAIGNVSVTQAALGALQTFPTTPFNFEIDFGMVSSLSGSSDVTLSSQNGFARGILEAYNIGQGGTVNGVFTNGLTRTLGQVALANFSNIGGLARMGDNLFGQTPATGPAQVGLPNTGGRGEVSGGVLEGSNVDLGTEFSDLIITQRGFQANARTISAADTLLQETVNLVR
jgi:flagellar hook protein FlgE